MIRKTLSVEAVKTIAEHLSEAGINYSIELPEAKGIMVETKFGTARKIEIPRPDESILPEDAISNYIAVTRESKAALCLIIPVVENAMAECGEDRDNQMALVVRTVASLVDVLSERYGYNAKKISTLIRGVLVVMLEEKKKEQGGK